MAKPKGSLAEYQGLPFFKLIVFGCPSEALHRDRVDQFTRKALAEIAHAPGRESSKTNVSAFGTGKKK
jgi:hypothetical protein